MGQKSLIGATFDLSFNHFVIFRVIRILFVLGLLAAGLLAVGLVVAAFRQGSAVGLGSIVVAPLGFLIVAFFWRLFCELAIVTFRIAESTAQLAEARDSRAHPAASPGVTH